MSQDRLCKLKMLENAESANTYKNIPQAINVYNKNIFSSRY